MLEDAGSIPASSTFAHRSRWLRRTMCVLATGICRPAMRQWWSASKAWNTMYAGQKMPSKTA